MALGDSAVAADAKGLEKLLDRALSKCDATKSDLDSLWTTQILTVGLSIALVVGLDDVASEALFHVKGYGRALDLVVPLVNLYFVMRFGFLCFAFSEARYAAQKFAERYIEERDLSHYFKSPTASRNTMGVERNVLYSTNSYFEPFYQKR